MNSSPRIKRQRITNLLLVGAIILSLVGSFAYFTDRESATATSAAGNIDLVFTDTSLAAESTGDNVQARDNVWTAEKLVVDGGILNPGDVIDMDYKVANTGSKSIDVKQQIVLTSSVALTDNTEEYTITVGGQNITPVKSDDDTTLTYELAEITLNGSVEEENGVAVTEQEYEVAMEFDRLAKNKFMNSTVTVNLDIQAKQHRNTTSSDWVNWAEYETKVEQITSEPSEILTFYLVEDWAENLDSAETFQFENGMTWEEWAKSSYATSSGHEWSVNEYDEFRMDEKWDICLAEYSEQEDEDGNPCGFFYTAYGTCEPTSIMTPEVYVMVYAGGE